MRDTKKNKRRAFIKNSIKAGVGASLLSTNTLGADQTKRRDALVIKKSLKSKKVIVGGAGIGGFCVAHELWKHLQEVGYLAK